ncbi:MAG TPA: glycosyltransferase family 4 protein [Gaiellaceae bacterium]|nr:glycosyltransferase family 4 protein [Gaiellaceae bacterium]
MSLVTRVVLVCPVPMPYTFPVLRLIAASAEVDLSVLYCRRALPARGDAPDPASFGFRHEFLADAGHVFVGRKIREIDVNPGLLRAIARLQPDLVVFSGYVQPTAVLGAVWSALRGRAYGLWVESHDLGSRSTPKRVARRLLVGPIVRRAALLLPTGEAAAASLAALGSADERMVHFPHVPDPEAFHARDRERAGTALRARLGVDAETPVIVYVGRLVDCKGLETLLEAQREVHGRTRARLLVVGTGPLERSLRAMGAPGVEFLGFLPPAQVAEVLRGADISISPSVSEPWGTVPLEAAASGCVVVASDVVPSAAELIAQSGVGALVPPGDRRALASAIVDILSDPVALRELSERTVERAARFTPELAAASFLEGVRSALATRGRH